jgi:isopentenyl-diphosphate delta-isomerase
MTAHREGILHRAFSVFIFSMDGKFLLQKRADGKYHSAGLWTNACCGHPLPGEDLFLAAGNRLNFEMGMDCTLWYLFSFKYKANLNNGLIENEVDHVFIGRSGNKPAPNPEEVSEWKLVSMTELKEWITSDGSNFTEWFKLIYERVYDLYVMQYDQQK